MKTTLYIIAIAVIFSSCKITGEYFRGNGFSYEYLKVNKDRTFTYERFNDIGGTKTIQGKWTKRKNTITLNSNEQPNFKPNSTFEKVIPNQDKKIIIVQNMDISAFKAIISINNSQVFDTLKLLSDTAYLTEQFPDFVTGVYTNIDSIKSIRILQTNNLSDCVLKDSLFYTSNPKANLIIIYAQPYNHYFRMNYIVNAEWKFKFNRIYTWRKTKSKYSKNNYLRKK